MDYSLLLIRAFCCIISKNKDTNLFKLNFLERVFNIKDLEWPRVFVAWFLRFFYRLGFVIGWTLIVALFVTRFGIAALPYLFVINGLFTILGTFFYSSFLDRFSKEMVLTVTAFVAGILLTFAGVYSDHQVLFFAILVVVEAVFMIQFKIVSNGFLEEMFTPLQSERVFPFLEAADTIGGICAGLLFFVFFNHLDAPQFLYFWIAAMFLAVPCVLFAERFKVNAPVVHKRRERQGIFTKFKSEIGHLQHFAFVKGLLVLIFLQWFLFNLMEFQYTKAIYANVSGVVMEAGSGFEHAFIHDLGAFFILFNGVALFVQLFAASRLIHSLGIFSSMLLHPIVSFLSFVGMIFSFGIYSAVLAKTNFTLTSVIFNNAYHSSYYAIKEDFREHVREFFEGVVRPLGAIAGTLALIFLQFVFKGEELTLVIGLIMLVVAVLLFVVAYSQQSRYTKLALEDLGPKNEKSVRLNAVDILFQEGHEDAMNRLESILVDEEELLSVRVRILKNCVETGDFNFLKPLISCLGSDNKRIQGEVLHGLNRFSAFGRLEKKNPVLEYELVENLKNFYKKSSSQEFKGLVFQVLSKLSSVVALEFLLDVLRKSKSVEDRKLVIYALGNYSDKNLVGIVSPYLRVKDFVTKFYVGLSLAKMGSGTDAFVETLVGYLQNGDIEKQKLALFGLGELKVKKVANLCVKFLYADDLYLKAGAALALAKMGDKRSIPLLVDLLFRRGAEIEGYLRSSLRNVDVRISKNLDKIIKELVLSNAHRIKSEGKLTKAKLEELKWLYELIEEYDEAA